MKSQKDEPDGEIFGVISPDHWGRMLVFFLLPAYVHDNGIPFVKHGPNIGAGDLHGRLLAKRTHASAATLLLIGIQILLLAYRLP